MLFGQNIPLLQLPPTPTTTLSDPGYCSDQLQQKLVKIVEANSTESAEVQKKYYPGQTQAKFVLGQRVFLDDPTRGKLDPGPWEVVAVKGPLTLELKVGSARRVVHVNRVRPLLTGKIDRSASGGRWTPPLFTHHDDTVENRTSQVNVSAQASQGANPPQPYYSVTKSGRIVRPPEYYEVNGNSWTELFAYTIIVIIMSYSCFRVRGEVHNRINIIFVCVHSFVSCHLSSCDPPLTTCLYWCDCCDIVKSYSRWSLSYYTTINARKHSLEWCSAIAEYCVPYETFFYRGFLQK